MAPCKLFEHDLRTATFLTQPLNCLPIQILACVYEVILVMRRDWSDILKSIQDILGGDGGGHFDPLANGTTVFDDGIFSRSRLLQWAINSLSNYKLSIDEAIGGLEDFQAIAFPDGHPKCSFAGSEKVLRQAMSRITKLKELGTKMDHLRTSATIERDGVSSLRCEFSVHHADPPPQLLNATGVMASRASTRLAENVQLLKYINIVFLPLSLVQCVFSKV
jgi:hypothetical protein